MAVALYMYLVSVNHQLATKYKDNPVIKFSRSENYFNPLVS